MAETKLIHFDGPCPFLMCLETDSHDHPICPDCGAVRYGNPECPTCQTDGEAYRDWELTRLQELRPSLFPHIEANDAV